MVTLDVIRRPVEEHIAGFEAFVERQFTAEGELLSEMLKYALSSRGKGIRPMLVMLSALLNSASTGAKVGQRSYVAAMLVEMIHVASLIHDDVIDEADQRRGKPSLNALWQSRNAVIVGDYILSKNMSIGMQSGQFDLVGHVTSAMSTLCEGEILQSDCTKRQSTNRKSYFDIIHRKTASLLSVSASVGALSVGAKGESVELMAHFGELIGMAFQIQDDILDYTPSAKTGKPALNDLREGKITLPLISVLERSTEERREELLKRLEKCRDDEEQREYMRLVVEQCGGIDEAVRVMDEYVNRALSLLMKYPKSEARDSLEQLCYYISKRDR